MTLNHDGSATFAGVLKVDKAGSGDAIAIFEDPSGNANILIKATTANKNSILNFGDSASAEIGQIDYDHNDNSMKFVVNASEAVRITSAGNVGIGTASPTRQLEVSNVADAMIRLSADTDDNATGTDAAVEFYNNAGELGYAGLRESSGTGGNAFVIATTSSRTNRLTETIYIILILVM